MSHDLYFGLALSVSLILTLGVLIRFKHKLIKLPYTVVMMLLGLAAGAIGTALVGRPVVDKTISLILSPDLIVYVFLPALIFQSAFGMDASALAKAWRPVSLLAVVALIVGTVLTAGLMVALTKGSWNWAMPIALVFGALISATDPVAVVALLQEIGAPKRLSIVVEGESLFNDGTAIVLFGVVYVFLTDPGQHFSLPWASLRFIWVVVGGLAVGWILAWAAEIWLNRITTDHIAQITLTIVLAYLAMIISQGFLDVSGVMAVFAAGIWLSLPHRDCLTRSARRTLDHLWELNAYLANTLIFFVVGLIAFVRLNQAGLIDLVVALGAYLGVTVIRFLLIFGFKPWLGSAGRAMTGPEATVTAWAGLRGAVPLALALSTAHAPRVNPAAGRQVLTATVVIALLSILINGGTSAWLLKKLGLGGESSD